jgi:hypothetical protein
MAKSKESKSALEAAYRFYEAGDVWAARRTARSVIKAPSADDQAAAKRVAKLLHGEGDKGEAQAELIAGEIIARTRPILRPYLWFIGGVTAYALLLLLAWVRYG